MAEEIGIELLQVLAEIYNPHHIDMGVATGRHAPANAMFEEIKDEGDPPAFISFSHRDFPFDFETVLGSYDADKRRITLYPKGITFVASEIDVREELIEQIVRYHECAHALHHLGLTRLLEPTEAAARLRKKDLAYRAAPNETTEQIAQIATLYVIKMRRRKVSEQVATFFDAMLDAFFKLMQRQSTRYKLSASMRSIDIDRLRDKLHLILDMSEDSLFLSAERMQRIIA